MKNASNGWPGAYELGRGLVGNGEDFVGHELLPRCARTETDGEGRAELQLVPTLFYMFFIQITWILIVFARLELFSGPVFLPQTQNFLGELLMSDGRISEAQQVFRWS